MPHTHTIFASLLVELRRDLDRWVLWLPVVFGTGIAVYFAFRAEPPWWTGPGAVALGVLSVYLARKRLADEQLDAGDFDGQAVWKRILAAIEELLSGDRPEDATVN